MNAYHVDFLNTGKRLNVDPLPSPQAVADLIVGEAGAAGVRETTDGRPLARACGNACLAAERSGEPQTVEVHGGKFRITPA